MENKKSLLKAISNFLEEFGEIVFFIKETFSLMFKRPYRIHLLIQQMYFVGIGSIFIVLLTGFFSGAVFTLESAIAFAMFGADGLVGSTVIISITREIGPVFCALMVTGRAASAMATELGTMRVSEQIDAMDTLAVLPIQYLVVPRVLAGFIMLPILTFLFDLVGVLGTYTVAIHFLDIDKGIFWHKIWWYLDPDDIYSGLIKAAFFGLTLSILGCYKGFNASGGARGVGVATTQAVVASSVAIFILDYILTLVMFST